MNGDNVIEFSKKEKELDPLEDLKYACSCGSDTWKIFADKVAECTECGKYFAIDEIFKF